MFRTSGFVDDVIFPYRGASGPESSATPLHFEEVRYQFDAGQLLQRSVELISTAVPRAKSDIYICLVLYTVNGDSGDNVEPLNVSSEADTPRQLYFLCPKCVLVGEPWPERISYRCMVDGRRKAVCSKWHNLGSWWRAVTGDYRFGGASSGVVTPDRPVVYSLTPTTLPDYEHPRLLLLLPPDPKVK